MTRRVLVCDDHPIFCDAISTCLDAAVPGCVIGVCTTAGQVLERLAEPDPWDLVVLDLALPDAFGLDALLRVRRHAPQARVAVLSAHEGRDIGQRALQAGAIAFLPKSTERGELVRTLSGLLGVLEAKSARIVPPRGAGTDSSWVHEAIAGLSPRQTQVLRLLIRGLPNKEICAELGLSENTIKIHIGAVLRAMRARNRTEAVATASRVGFAPD
jgi:DNA-binding NarL/FixJ family response regulator